MSFTVDSLVADLTQISNMKILEYGIDDDVMRFPTGSLLEIL